MSKGLSSDTDLWLIPNEDISSSLLLDWFFWEPPDATDLGFQKSLESSAGLEEANKTGAISVSYKLT